VTASPRRATLAVRHWRQAAGADGVRVSAEVGDVPLWFRFPADIAVAERGDPWLAIALLPAMLLDADLDLRGLPPISPRLLATLPLIQEIWTSWNPLLHRIGILADAAEPARMLLADGLSFFSGGIDGLFTARTRRHDIGRLVFIHGFDFELPPDQFADVHDRVQRLAARIERPVITVETNWMDLGRRHRLSRGILHGGCLAAVTHWLAPPRMLIASSSSYAYLYPSGTHPLLDPLWSTEATAIDHTNNTWARPDKLAALTTDPDLLADAWVCHDDPLRNCGRCAKCLRTRVTLGLLSSSAIPFADNHGDAMDRYARLVGRGRDIEFAEEVLTFADANGRGDAATPLRAALRRARLRRAVHDFRRRPRAGSDGDTWNPDRYDLHSWGPGPSPDW
jgi:hypothetical protein